jgi:squalene-hopene/tetraprenyl-beta-curcumene cyclase
MRSFSFGIRLLALILACSGIAYVATRSRVHANTKAARTGETWDKAAAAKYLDSRQAWWQDWPHAQKDHGTVCVSCHTQVPYALARPDLRDQLGEHSVSSPERAMLDSVIKRVNLGNEAQTFYSDAEHGPGKTKEARNAEAVNNTLILASYDSHAGHLQPVTLKAFDEMWATQEKTGDQAGAWIWQDFHFSPWEAPESEYYGAAEAAVAVGMAPDHYRDDAKIQDNLKLLRGYLLREAPNQPLINRVALLWASSKLPGLMTEPQRTSLAAELVAKQHPDGGWCLTDLGQGVWKRHDNTPFDLRSDGYATGIVVLALEENGLGKDPEVRKGLSWILANQDKSDGMWPAWSLNVKRKPDSDIGKFMSDAATGFSVLALENSR